MFVGDGGEGCAQIGVRVDGVEFASFDQGRHSRPSAAALIMAGEERVLSVQGDGADGVFDRVAVHLDAAIGQEDLQAVPVAVDVAELFAKAGFGGDAGALMGQPLAEIGDKRGGLCLANGEAFFGRLTPYAGFNLVDLGDAAQALGGDLGAVFLIDVVQLAAGMGPAIGQRQRRAARAAGLGQGVISGIAVHLQDAIEANQDLHRMAAAAPRRIGEDDRRGIGPIPTTVISGQRPQVASLRLARPGVKHRSAGLVCYPAGACGACCREGMKSRVERLRWISIRSTTGARW